MQFRKDIQGLRALAFLLIFIFHLNPKWLPGGYIGVDLFFVISGYLISSIVLNQREGKQFSLRSFYVKRFKRIAPAYFFMLLAVAIAGYFIYLPSDTESLSSALLHAALFLSNVLFADGPAYFGTQAHENPLLHTWSLAIEVQFYILIPLLLLWVSRKTLPYVVALLIIGLVAYSSWQIYTNHLHSAMYFSLPARIPEFLLGTLFSLIPLKDRMPGVLRTIAALIGLVGILASALLLTADSDFPGLLAVIPCISIGLILISGKNSITALLSLKPAVQVGAWSYSLYLWHWPIMAFMRYNMVDFGKTEYILITMATFALAYLSFTWVEQPFKSFDLRKFVRVFSPIVILVGLTAYFLPIHTHARRPDDAYLKPIFGLASHAKPFVETMGSENPTFTKRILLIGNSHALMTKPFLDYIGKRAGFSFHTITTDAYPAIAGIADEVVPVVHTELFKTTLALIPITEQEIRNSDIILFVMQNYMDVPSVKEALISLISSLHPHQKFVLIKSFPLLRKHPLRINRGIQKASSYDFKAIDLPVSDQLVKQLTATYANVYSYDLSKSKIFDTLPFYGDTLTYYDSGHINTYASIAMGKDLFEDFSNFMRTLTLP